MERARAGPLARFASHVAGAILAPLVPLSFSRPGFRARRPGFEGEERDLRGRVAVVTGANAGIGLATTEGLAARGAKVILACRSEARGEEARGALLARHPDADLEVRSLDMASLRSVADFVDGLGADRLDILVHNAGLLPDVKELSPDGLEMTFAVHVAGPFALTRRLLPALAASAATPRDGATPEGARVITVSSGGMYGRGLTLEDWRWERRPYDGVAAYAATKRMQVELNRLWADRWSEGDVAFHAMHPGWVDTGSVRSSLPRFHRLTRAILRDAEEGADTIVWLAAASSLPGPSGSFWFDRHRASTSWWPGTASTEAGREELWSLLERVVGD